MKKILLIGKVCTNLNEIGKYLGEHFIVHISADNVVMVRNMLKLLEPEMVLVYLAEFSPESTPLLEELETTYSHIPVFCLGTEEEAKAFDAFLEKENVLGCLGCNKKEEILNAICETLDVEVGETRKCILLVDDNAMQLRVLNTILKDKYEVKLATSGMKAIQLIEKKVPDIVFLDYEMPEQDGRETLQMIRGMEKAKDVPVVFLTGMGDKAHIESVLDLKPAGYLLKPASKEMLDEMLAKHGL